MANYSIIDTNDGGKIGRGSIGSVSALSTSITWFDLTNPGSTFPFSTRGAALATIFASIEGTFNMSVQVVFSLQDTQPSSTPAGLAGATAWPNALTIVGTQATGGQVPIGARWVGINCSAFTSGLATGWVSGIFPSR